jgi:hypothetical protein
MDTIRLLANSDHNDSKNSSSYHVTNLKINKLAAAGDRCTAMKKVLLTILLAILIPVTGKAFDTNKCIPGYPVYIDAWLGGTEAKIIGRSSYADQLCRVQLDNGKIILIKVTELTGWPPNRSDCECKRSGSRYDFFTKCLYGGC